MAGGASVENDRPEPTEASPLLGSKRDIDSHASSITASSSATAARQDDVTDGSNGDATVENGNGSGAQDGPKTAHKMHFLLPALAIGIFLSALDQTLIIATYAKMSSDLRALNRTSWISTA